MAVNIRPLHDRILAKRVEEKEQVRGGIIIPDTAKEKPLEAEIMAVGNGRVFGRWQDGSARRKSRRPCFDRKIFRHRSKAG